ncbi:MAG: family 10 glycosylhydrolase [Gemmatimonadaceae bacterium]|nr:family 10 glycosylhydrolase [Gemmatimonadaceae bacterium]
MSVSIVPPSKFRVFLRATVRGVAVACATVMAAETIGAQTNATAPPIPREFRAAWVATVANIDWPSRPGLSSAAQQAELLAILDRAVALHLNAIVLQVRPAADALYDSPYEPWSAYLTGVEGRAPEPYYDPLHFAVRAAHERGLELHAWFNPYRARHPTAIGEAARTHIGVRHPELVRRYGSYGWMDPGEPRVLAHSLRVMLDVVRRYDVDGIHIDDYFYPYPELGPDSQPAPFPDSASYARYRQRGGPLARDDWRRHNVDSLIHALYTRTKALKPWVKVGISPFGIWRPGTPAQIRGFDAYDKLYADARRWWREGWVDYLTPQLYWPIAQTPQAYAVLLRWWAGENVRARHLWVGHSAGRAASPGWPDGELADSGTTRTTAARAIGDSLRTRVYRDAALVPASPWLARGTPPVAPRVQVVRNVASEDRVLRIAHTRATTVRWWGVRLEHEGTWTHRVLPATQRSLIVAARGASMPTRILVTAVDRYGRESRAAVVR